MTIDYTPKPRPYHRAPPPQQNIQVHNPFIIPAEIQGPAEKRGPTIEDRIRGIIQRMRQQPTPAERPPAEAPPMAPPAPEPKSVLIR